MLPSGWVRKAWLEGAPGPGLVPAVDAAGNEVFAKGGLLMLQWRQHKGAATAALLILFALSIISNRAQRKNGLRQDNTVAATYEEIQAMVPLSRKMVNHGVQLLVMLKAVDQHRVGRACKYTLRGIEQNGHWCALPQAHLHNRQAHLQRLQHLVDQIRRPSSLHAVKLYMLILAFRDRHANFAAIGYDKIGTYTGLRREEISTAVQLLVSMQLVRLLTDEEQQRRPGDPHHNRYFVCGLNAA
jgi:hypothetical protein